VFGNDGAADRRCRDARENSDAGTARVAERMNNLSIHGANAGDIFPHANVKNARNPAEIQKTSKTTHAQ
jgi:hypothetical protein